MRQTRGRSSVPDPRESPGRDTSESLLGLRTLRAARPEAQGERWLSTLPGGRLPDPRRDARLTVDAHPDRITVLVVCGVRLYREGLAFSLGQQARTVIQVVGAASDVEEACRRARELEPALVLLDAALPRASDCVRVIHAETPGTRVLALALDESEAAVLEVAEAGAVGYVPRDGSLDDLVDAIEYAAAGEVICPPRIVASLFRRVASLAAGGEGRADPLADLTAREREVVLLIGEGLTNKEIARRLAIRLPTVKNHVHNVLDKLGVARRSAVAALLAEHELRREA